MKVMSEEAKKQYELLAEEMDRIEGFKSQLRSLCKQVGYKEVIRRADPKTLELIPDNLISFNNILTEKPWRENFYAVRRLKKAAQIISEDRKKGIRYKFDGHSLTKSEAKILTRIKESKDET